MPLTRRLAPAAIIAMAAVSAHAQDGDAAAGHAFAREACNACHMVEAKQRNRDASLSDQLSATSPIPAA
jgi:cytochrome c2